jgi:serine/threonine-protein kinase
MAESSKTIPAPPPQRFNTAQLSGRETLHPEVGSKSAGRFKQVLIIAAAVVVTSLVGGFLLMWLVNKSGNQTVAGNSSQATPAPNQTGKAPAAPPGMVYVDGGTFMMGRDNGNESERPAHMVSVKAFFIDLNEVTVEQYATFAKNHNGYFTPQTIVDQIYDPQHKKDGRQPAVGVEWAFAVAFCESVKKRLPTEEEWELAARGSDGRRYPWGNDWHRELANADRASKGMADVATYKGTSPFGLYDMVGNAWEWTASKWEAYPGGHLPGSVPTGELKVIRGGSYESTPDYATTTYRTGWPARGAKTYDQTGFRCAKDVQ